MSRTLLRKEAATARVAWHSVVRYPRPVFNCCQHQRSSVTRYTVDATPLQQTTVRNKKNKKRKKERDVCRSFDGIYRCVHECVRRLLMYRKKKSTKGDKRKRLLKTKSASSCSHYIAVYVASPKKKKYSECTRVPNIISS